MNARFIRQFQRAHLRAVVAAIVVAFLATTSSAAWILDGSGTILSNETWTLTVAAVTVGGEAGLKVTGWTAGTNDLDLTGTPGKVYEVSGRFASSGITSLQAPDTITYGADVFVNCTALTNAALSAGVKTIGKSAFQGCTALTAVGPTEFPELISIGHNAFDGCTSLEQDFALPALTALNHYVFRKTRATSIIASNVTWTGDSACPNLRHVEFSPAATKIDIYAFQYCGNLETLVPQALTNLTTVNSRAFFECMKLRGDFSFPALGTVGANAFCSTALTSINIPKCTTLNESCFRYCLQLTNAVVGATSFGDNCFASCPSLSNLTVNAEGAVSFGGSAILTTPPGLKIWYNSTTAPSVISANALKPANSSSYATFIVKPALDYAAWEALCARTKAAGTLTAADMARGDYPGKRVIGLIETGNNRAWVTHGPMDGTLLWVR
jgi:hypothetical protein